jgi:hypothetical protein
MVRVVGVEPSRHGAGGPGEGAPPGRRLHRLEVQGRSGPLASERLDLGVDLCGERGLEFFLPVPPCSVRRSQTRMYAWANSLKRRQFSVSVRYCATASAGRRWLYDRRFSVRLYR